ncbi:MAG: 50S ribosomal protein L11 methyltransferase [Chthoniobacterales bacterium]
MGRQTWRWVRKAPLKYEEAWRERLSFLPPDRLVIHGKPGGKTVRLEAYADRPDDLRTMAAVFGGKVEKFDPDDIVRQAGAPRRPLRIEKVLRVIVAHGKCPDSATRPRVVLRIGSALAVGTGEHATTAACLRFLADEARALPEGWSCLDLGAGSGILAIAAEKLGAGVVRGFDYDPRAVRAARANVTLNHCRRVTITAKNLLAWKPCCRRYRVVMANVFSETLRAAAASIVRAVAPQGCLVLSGILRPQERDVLRTFRPLGLALETASRRGKWVTLLLRAS